MPYPMEGAVQNLQIPTQPKGHRPSWFMVEKDLEDITENTLSEYRTEAYPLYLTSIGFGSWYFASRHPELFAAIVPVVGYGHPELMIPIAEHQLPIWVFAGGRDQAVKPEYFYPVLNELESQGHENLCFTIHAGMGHGVWVRVFAGQDVYDWMLMHERGGDKSLEPESRN